MSQQQDEYVDEGLFTIGDTSPQELLYGESAWAVNPMPMEPVPGTQPPFRGSGNRITVDASYGQGSYGYYHTGARSPSLLDYTVMNGLGIDFESEIGKKILEICAFHASYSEHSINAHLKAALLIEDWLTPAEIKELKADHRIMIKSKKHKKRTYVVHENPATQVEIWEGSKVTAKCCGIIEESGFCNGDRFLAKVMAIKTDEDDYVHRSSVTHV